MPLTPGTRLGPYEILSPIGAGGMGEVYRARDTKLDRDVAIKVLPEEFAADPERLARFEREAKLLASLNHPNIASIHGFEESDGVNALVLEFVEGPTLAERIQQGPIPVDEALAIAKQIAEALEAGHEAGVIHRDLKPANIKLKEDGTVKVLDYGLAKALEGELPSGGDSELSQSPTLTRQTQVGVILGTAAYMSPEQARGKPVDRRADIWSFGAVSYEMLTATKPFPGDDISQTLARVIDREPDWKALPPAVSPTLAAFLRRCLEKEPRKRVQAIGDVRLAMDGAFDVETGALQSSRPVLPWAVAGLAVLSAILYTTFSDSTPPNPGAAARFAVPVDGELPPREGTLLALSPNGHDLVFAAVTDQGDQLYHRTMNRLEARPLAGTEGARAPFFSPDGQWVAFQAIDGRLKKIPLSGGPPVEICDCILDYDGAWGADGTIVYSDRLAGGIMRASSDGGAPEPLTIPAEGEVSHDGPVFSPSGEAVLFTVTVGSLDDARLGAVLLSTGERKILGDGFFPRFTSTGDLIYGQAGAVWAVPFDADRLEMSGTPVQVLDDVRVEAGSAVQLGLAGNGAAYIPGGLKRAERTLVWVDRDGNEELLRVPRQAYQSVAIAPNGERVVLEVLGTGLENLWLYDVRGQRVSQFTFDASDDIWPVWTSDGESVVFSSQRGGPFGLYEKRADGVGEPRQIVSLGGLPVPHSVSPDGRIIAYQQVTPESGWDLLSVALDDEPRLEPLLAGDFQETHPAISPDGQWLAYASDESGQREIYVSPFSDPADTKWRVSRDGGSEPVWSADGGELFYRDGSAVLSVLVDADSAFAHGEPRLVIDGPYFRNALYGRTYDVTPDGQHLLMIRETGPVRSEIVVIQNWFEELKRLVPTQ